MNIHAIACKVIGAEDISLTAYQIQALLNIINELPEIEKHALEEIRFDNNPNPRSICGRAIQSLKDNEVFVAIVSLSVMSTTDLINVLTAISTGNEDDFGYWTRINEDRPKRAEDYSILDDFLFGKICYGKPTPDHDSYYVDDTETPYETAYLKLLQERNQNVNDPTIVWLDLDCKDVIENKLKVSTPYELLRALDAYSEPDFCSRFGKNVYEKIDAFFKSWLGDNYLRFAD